MNTQKSKAKHKNQKKPKLMGLDYIKTEINLYTIDFFNKSSPSVHKHCISFDLLKYSFSQ